MKDTLTLGRREFTVQAALALLSGAAITISGCGGGGGSPTTPSNPAPGPTPAPSPTPSASPTPSPAPAADKVGAISANHGHSAVITGPQITAGNALTLNIQGSADHDHTISLTAAQIVQVGAGQRVSVVSTTGQSHDHTVTLN